MSGYFMYSMAGIGIAAAICFVLVLGSIGSSILTKQPLPSGFAGENSSANSPVALAVRSTQDIAKFSSIDELQQFLTNVESSRNAFATPQVGIPESLNSSSGAGTGSDDMSGRTTAPLAPNAVMSPLSGSGKAAISGGNGQSTSVYSGTNNQVTGVDEPDFVKNDDKYAYVLSGDKLTISSVYPPENAKIVAKVGLGIKNGQYLQDMFLKNNTLVVFCTEYAHENVIPQYDFAPQTAYLPKTHAFLIDISDRTNPKTAHDYVISGVYYDARLMGDRVFIVTKSEVYSYRHPLVPKITESSKAVAVPDIYYFKNPEPYYNFNIVTSIGLKRMDDVTSKTFMMSPASTLYVSQDNIYIAYQKYLPFDNYEQSSRDRFFTAVIPLLPNDVQEKIKTVDSDPQVSSSSKWDSIAAILEDTYNHMTESEKTSLFDKIQRSLADYDAKVQKDATKTVIHKISIGPNGEIDYKARGEVPGRLLNQFSLDESGNKFRVATTVEYFSPYSNGIYTNVYVLDGDTLQTLGNLERIQPGETMYSTRFIGDRLYLVTFQRVDPFFVVDLSHDTPKVLGALKLPGYSTYLHPYDKNHVIGIGKDTAENSYGNVVPTGVKLALFDVSEVANPKLVNDYTIPGQGTDSEVFQQHKALLFNREKPNVLSIPITKFDTEGKYAPDGRPMPQNVWRGFYVFGVSGTEGITLKATVQHTGNTTNFSLPSIQGARSFYIGHILYTVSGGNLIKMNDIDTLAELGQLQIGSTRDVIKYLVPSDAV